MSAGDEVQLLVGRRRVLAGFGKFVVLFDDLVTRLPGDIRLVPNARMPSVCLTGSQVSV
jgi:hypothetical protein